MTSPPFVVFSLSNYESSPAKFHKQAKFSEPDKGAVYFILVHMQLSGNILLLTGDFVRIELLVRMELMPDFQCVVGSVARYYGGKCIGCQSGKIQHPEITGALFNTISLDRERYLFFGCFWHGCIAPRGGYFGTRFRSSDFPAQRGRYFKACFFRWFSSSGGLARSDAIIDMDNVMFSSRYALEVIQRVIFPVPVFVVYLERTSFLIFGNGAVGFDPKLLGCPSVPFSLSVESGCSHDTRSNLG